MGRKKPTYFAFANSGNICIKITKKVVVLSKMQSLRGDNASCPCTIVFNTSSLVLEGAISAVGELALTAGGTEVAVWSFDQVSCSGPVRSVTVGVVTSSPINYNSPSIRLYTFGSTPSGFTSLVYLFLV